MIMMLLKAIFFSAAIMFVAPAPALTTSEVNNIFNTLLASSGAKGIKLQIVQSDSFNAWSTCSTVIMTTRLMKDLTPDEMAFVLGHEIGHIKLHHMVYKLGVCTNNSVFKKSEADADMESIKIMHGTSYSACAGGRGFFIKLTKLYGDLGGPTDTHPANSWRLEQVNKNAC